MIIDEEVYLQHFGVKGMQWGVRNDRPGGVSRGVNRQARKDAEEFARAKAFYGKGAGTRRKLIKGKIEGRSNNIPGYKAAFNHHLSNQDPSKHVDKAISERKIKDRKEKGRQTVGALARRFTGEMGTQAAFVAATLAGVAYLKSSGGQATMRRAASSVTKVVDAQRHSRNAAKIADFINK